jgi:hypothetical protein
MKFGRKPAVHTRRTMRSALVLAQALAPLGSPPTVSDDYVSAVNKVTGGDWGMMGNDTLGDCVCADSGHQVMIHTANAGTMITPTDADVLALYEAVGGYVPGDAATDQGCDETSMCAYMQATGIAGQKSAGTAMVDPLTLDHIRWAVQLFGACRLGITVGQDSVDQFKGKQPWEAPTTDPNAGGHDVPAVGYDAEYVRVITWGGEQLVAWSLMANPDFLQEAHAEVFGDWLTVTGVAPSGLDMPALLAALPQVQ